MAEQGNHTDGGRLCRCLGVRMLDRDARTVAFYTLGCKVNQYDSAAVASLFRERGFRVVPFEEEADVYVVNTCTVTATSDRKSRQILRRARRRSSSAVVVAMGCYSQTNSRAVQTTTDADLVFGTGDHDQIVDAVQQLLDTRADSQPERIRVRPSCEYDVFEDIAAGDTLERTRAFVKIEDGCDQFCTYCKVPQARGPVRSRSVESVLTQVRSLVGMGFREIVLIGVHLGHYGRDLGAAVDLADITAAVAEVEGVFRVRLGSVECTEVTPKLLDVFCEHSNVCRHLHVPLQSGDDRVLLRMGRPYTTSQYLDAVQAIRDRIPECAIGADVMVGFPGETEDEFARSLEFVKRCELSRLHVFGYSRRAGTPAASAPDQVQPSVIDRRVAEMSQLGRQLSEDYHRTMVGQVFTVLVEESDSETDALVGHTDTYVRVLFRAQRHLPPNSVARVRILSADADGVQGEYEYEGDAGLISKEFTCDSGCGR